MTTIKSNCPVGFVLLRVCVGVICLSFDFARWQGVKAIGVGSNTKVRLVGCSVGSSVAQRPPIIVIDFRFLAVVWFIVFDLFLFKTIKMHVNKCGVELVSHAQDISQYFGISL